MRKLFFFLVIVMSTYSCATIIPNMVKKKTPKLCDSEYCQTADQFFWDSFHNGAYDSIPKVLVLLKNAYSQNTRDYRLAAHIGFAHAWALAENHRLENRTAVITDHATLAVKYFQEAFDLAPEKEWRYYGFLVSMMMADGAIHNDMPQMIKGFFKMKKAVRKYPEFNLFTAAYTLAGSPRAKDRDKALALLKKNIEKCVGEKVDLLTMDYRKYNDQKDLSGKMSTCWNNWIAPHNLEGFFMVMGDLLAKKGRYAEALNVYKNCTYAEGFEHWAFYDHLNDRMQKIESIMASKSSKQTLTFIDFDGCMVCHQGKELAPTPQNVHMEMPLLDVSLHLKK